MLSVEDIEGKWKGEVTTGLTARCKESWNIPLDELEDIMVITYLNQRIALNHMVREAERRLELELRDDTELYDGQLNDALERAQNT